METITAEYLQEQKILHRNPNYGIASFGFAEQVGACIRHMSAETVTDYGAGKKNLKKALDSLGVGVTSIKPLIRYFRNTVRRLKPIWYVVLMFWSM